MADDWAKKYADTYKQKRQETQEKTRLAKAVAPDTFRRIKDRIESDLNVLHQTQLFESAELKSVDAQTFSVVDVDVPGNRPGLVVTLNGIVVQYEYLHFEKRKNMSAPRTPGALRICSDVHGVSQVYRNGDSQAFTDESEISDFLLRPLLDYMSSQ